MSIPPQNYYNINTNYRYFGRDLTNVEPGRNHFKSSSREIKLQGHHYKEPNPQANLPQRMRESGLNYGRRSNTNLNNNAHPESLLTNHYQQRNLSSQQHRRTSSLGQQSSQFMKPRISNFSNIDDSRNFNNPVGLGCYYVANNLKTGGSYGMKMSNVSGNYGSKRSLNINLVKNGSPMSMSRNLSREHVVESSANFGKFENKINEYIMSSRRNSGLLGPKRSQDKARIPRQSFERPPINRNGSFHNQQENRKYAHVSSRVSGRMDTHKSSFVLNNYFAMPRYPAPKCENLERKRNSSRRNSSLSNTNDFKLPGLFLKNSFTDVTDKSGKSPKTKEYDFHKISHRVMSAFDKEIRAYELSFKDVGFNFGDTAKLHMPNVWNYLVNLKNKNIPKKEYIKSGIQLEITERMRGILVDWLVDVHKKFRLRTHTLFIAVNLIDRALEKFIVEKQNFQLLGITCLFIASKYEEIYPPPMSEYTYVCADAYTDKDLLNMEAKILNSLGFNLVFTSSFALFNAYSEEKKIDKRAYNLGLYILHISLLSTATCRNNSCDITAAVYLLTEKLLKTASLDEESLIKDFDCDKSTVRDLSRKLFVILCEEKNTKLSAARRKFEQSKYMEISAIKVNIRNDN